MSKIRVLVVDDSAFMRNVLTRIIAKDDRFELVGVAVNGQEAVEKAADLKPDLITMDVEMPIMTGLEALEKIMTTAPRPVVMISSLTEAGRSETMRALEIGAVDFIPKALHDDSRSIFQAGGEIHDKLAAAAKVQVRGARVSVAPTAVIATKVLPQVVKPAAVSNFQPNNTGLVAGKLPNPEILIIGSSTGGPKALLEIIPKLPANLKVPVVVAQHMPAGFTQAMANRLNDISQLHISEAANGDVLKVGSVYIAPGAMHLRVTRGISGFQFTVKEDKGESPYKPSVNVLAKSVMECISPRHVMAVMLTGMGDDGAAEFLNLKNGGAFVVAQSEETCAVYGMPKSVVERGAANDVLPLEKIVSRITQVLG